MLLPWLPSLWLSPSPPAVAVWTPQSGGWWDRLVLPEAHWMPALARPAFFSWGGGRLGLAVGLVEKCPVWTGEPSELTALGAFSDWRPSEAGWS